MTKLYEWKCRRCGSLVLAKGKPSPPAALIKRVPCCPKCKVPTMDPTGNTRNHYSIRELL